MFTLIGKKSDKPKVPSFFWANTSVAWKDVWDAEKTLFCLIFLVDNYFVDAQKVNPRFAISSGTTITLSEVP